MWAFFSFFRVSSKLVFFLIVLNTQAIDYEEQTSRNVSISVENEEPSYYCRVRTRTSMGLWEVDSNVPDPHKPYPVTITVVDINDPPEFIPPVQEMKIMENEKIGTHIGILTVKDPDKTFGNAFE